MQILKRLHKIPFYLLALLLVVMVRLIKPFYLVRFGPLFSSRIGHFAGNTELYLCEKDAGINVPKKPYIDLFYMDGRISNYQLCRMWKRVLCVWPSSILGPAVTIVRIIGRFFPKWKNHEIGNNLQHDRDIFNLLEKFPPHLSFTDDEEAQGKAALKEMGINENDQFVCLIVRDSSYLEEKQPGTTSYHDYRDSDIDKYRHASEELANQGYFVIRMGALVEKPLISTNPKVIDYATNGLRSDFMDIYLCSKCHFFISNSCGLDAVATLFRSPLVIVNMAPLGYIPTWRSDTLFISKHYWSIAKSRKLTVKEIFSNNVGFLLRSEKYESNGIYLIDNTPREILSVVIEMVRRLDETLKLTEDDECNQEKFWSQFSSDKIAENNLPLHGEIRSRIGTEFLKINQNWLS